jgi:hypothetical protein
MSIVAIAVISPPGKLRADEAKKSESLRQTETFEVQIDVPSGTPGAAGTPGVPLGAAEDVLIMAPGRQESQALILAQATASRIDEQTLRQRLHQLREQQQGLAREYDEVLKAWQQNFQGGQQAPSDPQKAATWQAAVPHSGHPGQFHLWSDRMGGTPLPPNAVLKVFRLQHVRPGEAGQVLHNIVGGGPRIAIDERINALVMAGDDKQLSVAEKLLENLDQPGPSQKRASAETLQLRIVWLLDGINGADSGSPAVSPQVVEALGELGLREPRVMCQQLTTLTVRPDERRSGTFRFQVPVLVNDDVWQFEGQGTVASTDKDKYALDIGLTVQQRGEQGQRSSSELSGSIITPLAHYTVVGTTTFVATNLEPAEGGRGKVVAGRNQHLAAFVVFLDRAREFGGESGKVEKKLPPSPK